jgi:biopolymer transport protein ExbB
MRLNKPRFLSALFLVLSTHLIGVASSHAEEKNWWNPSWTIRKKIDIDTTGKGVAVAEPIGTSAVLVRLHEGVFSFMSAKEDGSDLRFTADDHKTVLKHHVEKWDSLLNEAYVWVQVPDLKPAAATTIWLYYGNTTEAVAVDPAKETYDPNTTLAYHFADVSKAGADSSPTGANAEGAPPPAAGSLIGGGLRVFGQTAIKAPAPPLPEWAPGAPLTVSVWVKPSALQPNAVILSRRDGANAFILGLDNGVPFVEVNKQRSSAGAPIAAGGWHHIAAVADAGNVTVYLDGKSYGAVTAAMPSLKTPVEIDKDTSPAAAGMVGFTGEMDELQIAKTARPAGFIQFAAVNQGTTADSGKLVVVGSDEASDHEEEGEIMKHLTLIKDISKDLTFDGWVVIFLCTVLAVVGWGIAVGKILYLNTIEKASKEFLKRWEKISSDLTAIDTEDTESVKTLGGTVSNKMQKLMRQSPLYQLYHLGSEEIQHRMKAIRKVSFNTKEAGEEKKVIPGGLSGRSIQAIKAALHGGMVREVQKLNGKLVFLTIGIAGGPYLGLLGTVIGVMITFAVIAKSGEVEVNSIAPGIAGALLATVAGLAVAIPALFIYSYLSSRIKDVVTNMETFIDEFIAKMAELYKE